MPRSLLLVAGLLAAVPPSAVADDLAAKFAGEWLIAMGPLTLKPDGDKLAGRLTF